MFSGAVQENAIKPVVLLAAALCFLGCVFVAEKSIAADWKNSSKLELRSIYNDNLRLTTQPHDSVKGTITNISLGVTAATETSELTLKPNASFERYDTEELLDDNLQSLPVQYTAQTERSQTTVKLEYTRDNTLTSELEDTGLVDTNKRRVRWNAAPSYLYTLNERNSVQVGLGYTSVNYLDAQGTGLVDYTAPSLYAGHIYALSETGQLTTTLYGSKLEASKVHNVTDDYGLRLTFKNQLTELVSYSVQLSGHRTTTNLEYFPGLVFKETQTGRLFGGDITRQGEYLNWKLAVDSSLEPSSAGVLVKRNRISLDAGRRLKRSLRGSINLSTTFNREVNTNNIFSDWEYRRASTLLSWRMKQKWNLQARYNYYWQKYDVSEAIAESNSIMFSVLYLSNRN